jgi:hypothetical protein
MQFITIKPGMIIPVAENLTDLDDPDWLDRDGAQELREAVLATPPGNVLPVAVKWGPPGHPASLLVGELPIDSRAELQRQYEPRLAAYGKRKRTAPHGDWVLTVLTH